MKCPVMTIESTNYILLIVPPLALIPGSGNPARTADSYAELNNHMRLLVIAILVLQISVVLVYLFCLPVFYYSKSVFSN